MMYQEPAKPKSIGLQEIITGHKLVTWKLKEQYIDLKSSLRNKQV